MPKLTRQLLAKALGISRQQLDDDRKDGCPMDSITAARKWRANNRAPRNEVGSEPAKGESVHARLLLAKAIKTEQDGEARRLKNEQIRGELVAKDEIVREFAEFLTSARAILDALPDDIATECPHDLRSKVHSLAKQCVDRTLRKLAQWQPSSIPADEILTGD
jgi:hypothetical protein